MFQKKIQAIGKEIQGMIEGWKIGEINILWHGHMGFKWDLIW